MKVIETTLSDCLVLEPSLFNDKRGYFFESFNSKQFNELTGFNINFVQDNESFSTKGVLRGLHFQKDEYAQAKLIRVVTGKVLDVAVDLRKNSTTFGKWFSIELSGENKRQLYVPRGFAHGFVVLSEFAIFNYKCDNFYNKASESGIIFNDSALNIDWQLNTNEILVSEKDLELPYLETLF